MKDILKKIGKFFLLFIFIFTVVTASTTNWRTGENRNSSVSNEKVSYSSLKNGEVYSKISNDWTARSIGSGHGIEISAKEIEKFQDDLIRAKETGDNEAINRYNTIIGENAKKIVGYLAADYNLTSLYEKAEKPLSNIASYLIKIADSLLLLLTVLEIIMMFVSEPTKFPLDGISERIVRYFILKFIIYKWTDLTDMLKGAALKIATAASGGGSIRIAPQEAWDAFSYSITSSYGDMSWFSPFSSLIWAIILLPALILCAFIVADLFMALLEYKVLTGFAVLLVPFISWRNTRDIGNKIFTVFSSQVVRLILMYFFLAIAKTLIPNTGAISFYSLGLQGMSLYFKYAIILWIVRILIGKTPALASALMSGGTAMTGKDATSPVGGLIGGITGTAIGVIAGIVGYKAIKNQHSSGKVGAGIGSKMANAAKKMFKDDNKE